MSKQKTWDTAGGENSKGYDIYHFLDRLSGFTYDDSANAVSCHLRELLANRTGTQHFVREGDSWYRNVEFGKIVNDPGKRGRMGAGRGKIVSTSEMNPYPAGETYQAAHRPYSPDSSTASK
jgi:hypothetical protein